MKTNKWILGGLMAMAITACTSDELVEHNSQQPAKGEVVSVTAYTPGDGADTRVTPTDDGVRLVSLAWDKKDSFTVIQGNANTNFTNGDGGGNTFTGVLPNDTSTDDDNFYAVYPVLSVSEASESSASVTVPFDLSEQTGALDASKTYMYASSKSGLSYQFNHLTAILKASFFGLPDGAIVKELVITTSAASKVDGTIDFTETGEAGSKVVNASITGGTKNTIIIDYTNKSFSNPVYIYLPPMDADKKALAFEVSIEGGDSYTGTLGAASTPEPSEGESSNANQGQGIEAGKLYVASVQMSKVRLIAEGLSFDHNTQTFSVTTAFALQLLDKWISNEISTANFKKYEFQGNNSALINDNNRYSLNISIKANIELPLIDIATGEPITITNGVPSGSNWTAIGTDDNPYTGTIDGNGKILYGMVINATEHDHGFVGNLGNNGQIKNLTFANAQVTSNEFFNTGIVAGCNDTGIVENCHTINTSSVKGYKDYSYVGGIVGINKGTITNCTNAAQVEVTNENSKVGGITGYNDKVVSFCINSGSVRGSKCVGGIVGEQYGGEGVIVIACGNTGSVSGGTLVGGIVGLNNIFSNAIASWTITTEEKNRLGTIPGTKDGFGNRETITACYSVADAAALDSKVGDMNTALRDYYNANNAYNTYYWTPDTNGGWPTLTTTTPESPAQGN